MTGVLFSVRSISRNWFVQAKIDKKGRDRYAAAAIINKTCIGNVQSSLQVLLLL